MKVQEVARVFGLDPKTIRNWTDSEDFREFFSSSARGEGGLQRDYDDRDLIILNTIFSGRRRGDGWGVIADRIRANDLEIELPASALLVQRELPAVQYGRMVALQIRYEELKAELEALRQKNEEMSARHQAEMRALLEESREREGRLQREIGRLLATIDLYRQSETDSEKDP